MRLDVLSEAELKGFLNPFSSLKFVKKSLHELPFSQGLTVRGAHFGGIDPFCRALVNVDGKIDKNNFSKIIFTELIDQRDKKVKDFIPTQSGFEYHDYPIYSMAFPWDSHTYNTFKENYLEMVVENRREHIADSNILSTDFIYSDEYVSSHLDQFNMLLDSIKIDGYDPYHYKEYPKVLILKDDNHWKWMMSGQGNHRAFLLSMLGYENLSCEIIKVVNRSDVDKWSNVINGVYQKDHALKIFDLIFTGTRVCKGIV
mgnify:FL=1|jgi:hypothetical protein